MSLVTTMNPHSLPQPRPLPGRGTHGFVDRHIGPRDDDIAVMLEACGCASLEDLIAQVIPPEIMQDALLALSPPRNEARLLADLEEIAGKNTVVRSCIGMGYSDTILPPVIRRNILENPGWYTQYTPYQSEIAQGRLEALLVFQTMVADLTGLPVANASLLDEATAAAEAMMMTWAASGGDNRAFHASDRCHPQTIAVLEMRARAAGISLRIGPVDVDSLSEGTSFGALVQYPDTWGSLTALAPLAEAAHAGGSLLVAAADLLALALLQSPGEAGVDIAIGSTQRFGIPMGCGGPHAAYIATRESLVRKIPGRLVGVSRDTGGREAYRLTIQTREQHIRRDRATSNICTAQALLAIMAGMYAVWHGPEGLCRIALTVHARTRNLAAGLRARGYTLDDAPFFDTLRVTLAGEEEAKSIVAAALAEGFNLRHDPGTPWVGIALDETTTREDVNSLLAAFNRDAGIDVLDDPVIPGDGDPDWPDTMLRREPVLAHTAFHTCHSETQMLRYITRLQNRDLSLAQSMIPLGSCTMKLNATSEMLPVSWPEFSALHPFAPADQLQGYQDLCTQLEGSLCEITGFAGVTLQPNAGAQGEYTGLRVIAAWHASRGQDMRTVCLIPVSAHGTNPASAVAAGFQPVAVACLDSGDIDLEDLRARVEACRNRVGALMVTYPSTHGVFEEGIMEACAIVHEAGGQVYLDGANLNAMVGLCRPASLGADICHLNLHKTFCIPHGGGGPGMGPVAAAPHLCEFLPGHPVREPSSAGSRSVGTVSAAPWGSASILPVSWVYIGLMGGSGLRRASEVAILSANYMRQRLTGAFEILFTGRDGFCGHEFILDCRAFEKSAGITVEDIAKRLMDYGFHAPTISWPVPGTMMIEPTESESRDEMDRYCDALCSIREEIREVEEGTMSRGDNLLTNAPHPVEDLLAESWAHPYSRDRAGYPMPWLRQAKFWPSVSRIDNPWGDRNLCCHLPALETDDEQGGSAADQ